MNLYHRNEFGQQSDGVVGGGEGPVETTSSWPAFPAAGHSGIADARAWLTVFIVVVMAILVGMVVVLDFPELETFLPIPSK